MNKKSWHYYYQHYFKHIKARYFIIIALVLLTVSVFALRNNNETMINLRDQVYLADKNNNNVQGALDKLQAYVVAHMNTNLSSGSNAVYPPIQLKYTYQRLVSAQEAYIASTNTNLYTNAENYCQTVIPIGTTNFLGGPRVPCIEQYVKTHGAQASPISPSLYEFDFISPTWSPDLAGFSLLFGGLFLIIGTGVFIINFILKRVVS